MRASTASSETLETPASRCETGTTGEGDFVNHGGCFTRVHIPAGPAPAEAPIHLDVNDALVAALPWLPWDPAPAAGGVPRVSLDLSGALSAFAIKCSLDRSPAAMAAFAPINMLTLRLSANAWSRLLTYYDAARVLLLDGRGHGDQFSIVGSPARRRWMDGRLRILRTHTPLSVVAVTEPPIGAGANPRLSQVW